MALAQLRTRISTLELVRQDRDRAIDIIRRMRQRGRIDPKVVEDLRAELATVYELNVERMLELHRQHNEKRETLLKDIITLQEKLKRSRKSLKKLRAKNRALTTTK